MAVLPPDHPDRLQLASEVHARPPEPLDTPARATYVAVLFDVEARKQELAHIEALCALYGVPPPKPGSTHFSTGLDTLRFKWERHGEFSGYTFCLTGSGGGPFQETAVSRLPEGWLEQIPGSTIVAAHATLLAAAESPPEATLLAHHFDGNIAVGAEIGDGSGFAFTDFRVHADGYARFVVFDRSLTPRQAGRTLQRLFEIEVYRMLALLALPIARRQSPRIVGIEGALAALTDSIAQDQRSDDESLLQELTRLAAEVESGLASSQFRFGACRAYFELVTTRIAELREQRLPGIQTIEEFMARRFTPAVATCTTVSQRLHDLSERVAQTSALLSTRVDITRERQNQALLASMDRRAKLQLRLQQTVEGLSVAAIVYYVAGLIGYVSKGLKAGGLHVEPDLVVGIAIPLVALGALWTIRRAKHHIAAAEAGQPPAREL
ncbi:MAG: DUF3422 domain-containing protein [Burkholderiaceae bacterium]|nr:DUF3422 domain-containing protein [Burkholderiaceae bacterium]